MAVKTRKNTESPREYNMTKKQTPRQSGQPTVNSQATVGSVRQADPKMKLSVTLKANRPKVSPATIYSYAATQHGSIYSRRRDHLTLLWI